MTTELYYAFVAGLAAGVVLTIGALAVAALRTLGEEDLPEDEPRYTRRWQD